jgi:flagellar biosynthesis protein
VEVNVYFQGTQPLSLAMEDDRDFQPNAAPIFPSGRRAVAVAIKGSFGDTSEDHPDSLSKVIASGYGKLAEQILDMAFEKGIKVREDADLAELLATLDLDTPIPSEAIVAVAEILAKVYEANAKIAAAPDVKGHA